MMTREAMWERLGDDVDVVVIGGGITGSGIARDAARRGLSVALLEMNDLAWRELMHLFHDIRPGRAKLALWKLFQTAAKMEHVNIFKSTTAIIGDSKDLKIGSNSKKRGQDQIGMASPQRTSHQAWSSREWSPSQVHLDAGGAHQGPQARLRDRLVHSTDS